MRLKQKIRRKMVVFLSVYAGVMLLLLALILVLTSGDPEAGTILPILGGLTVLPVILMLVFNGLGKYTGTFDQYYSSLSETEKEHFDKEAEETGFRIKHAVLTEKCVVTIDFMRLAVVPYDQIVWLYRLDQFVYFMRIRSLVLVSKQKKLITINLGKEAESLAVQEFIRRIQEKRPGVLVGTSDVLSKMFRKDFERMKQMSDQSIPAETGGK